MNRRSAGLRDNTGLVDGRDKGRGAAVHDRHFRTVDLDDGVVDPHATQCGKHVLGGGNQRTFAVAQDGCELGRDHRLRRGTNFAVAALKSRADKNKTRIEGCRSDGQIYR